MELFSWTTASSFSINIHSDSRQSCFKNSPHTSITAAFCRQIMPVVCSCSLKTYTWNFAQNGDNDIKSKFFPGVLPRWLQMEAPLLVDIVHNSTGKHEKKAVVQAVKHLNWTGFINFDITILLGMLYYIDKYTKWIFDLGGTCYWFGCDFLRDEEKGLILLHV